MSSLLPVGGHGILALTIPVEWAAIAVTVIIFMVSGGLSHLKVVWDIRSELRSVGDRLLHVGEKLSETMGDIDHIRRDVEEIKLDHAAKSAHHDERITALEQNSRSQTHENQYRGRPQ